MFCVVEGISEAMSLRSSGSFRTVVPPEGYHQASAYTLARLYRAMQPEAHCITCVAGQTGINSRDSCKDVWFRLSWSPNKLMNGNEQVISKKESVAFFRDYLLAGGLCLL